MSAETLTAEDMAAMYTEDEARDRAYDLAREKADQQWADAPVAQHYLTVKLRRMWGPEYSLRCDGDRHSRCHLMRIEEDWPDLETGPDCNVKDWFNSDQRSFVEEGYVGPDRDGITSGFIHTISLGEDGIEWEYQA